MKHQIKLLWFHAPNVRTYVSKMFWNPLELNFVWFCTQHACSRWRNWKNKCLLSTFCTPFGICSVMSWHQRLSPLALRHRSRDYLCREWCIGGESRQRQHWRDAFRRTYPRRERKAGQAASAVFSSLPQCLTAQLSGSQSGRYRPPGVNWTIQGVDK